MQNLTLTWQVAGGASVVLHAVAYPVKRAGHPSLVAILREAGTLLGLFALWQLAGSVSLMGSEHALDRGAWIYRTERRLGFPDEVVWQRAALPHPWLVTGADYYYAVMHFGAVSALLLWLFLRHRDRYVWVRTTVVVSTAACLLIQFIPVAPPRMLTADGFVDMAASAGQSVYSRTVGGVVPDQLSAMPSVHVAWCVIVAVAVIAVSRSRWRWLIVLHPIATVAVVIVTANHFWADGLVALALLLVTYLSQHLFAGRGIRRPGAGPAPAG